MSQESQIRSISDGPQKGWFYVDGHWGEIQGWIYKDGNILVQIGPNVKVHDDVREWKTKISRVCNGIRIDGPSWRGDSEGLDNLKKLCEQECEYFNSIMVPDRDITQLGKIKQKENV